MPYDMAMGSELSRRQFHAIARELFAETERLESKNANQSETIRQYQGQITGGDLSLGMLIAERDKLKTENAGLKTGYEAYEQIVKELRAEVEALRLRCDRLDADKVVMAETHVLYSWLRKKVDQPSNDFVAVQMSIGHDWVPVHDLDRDLRSMIEREEP